MEKKLLKKEKALAEAAALLLVNKKVQPPERPRRMDLRG
jgi:hypothetical protein